jgi:2-methylisocitrate lyase-like PEP mutase family enzyme
VRSARIAAERFEGVFCSGYGYAASAYGLPDVGFVIARTDATDPAEGIKRAVRYAKAGADGIMVEAVRDLQTISRLRSQVSVPRAVSGHDGEDELSSLGEHGLDE